MHLMPESPVSEPRFVWGVFVSFVFHLILITVLVGVPSWYKPERTYFSSAYRVNLVELPGERPGGGKGQGGAGDASAKKVVVSEVPQVQPKKKVEKGTKAAKQPPPEPIKKSVSETQTAQKKSSVVAIAEKAEKKSSAPSTPQKAKTVDAEKEYSRALDKIRDKVGEEQRQEEIARIREKIAGGGQAAGMAGSGAGVAGSAGGPGDGSGGIPSGGGRIANLPLNYRLYYQVIEQKIKSNWNLALPRGILEDMRGMEVVMSVTIRSDGEITDVSFERKTGNVYLDDSAYRSVKKSSPLPPFVDYNIKEPFFETGIVFPVGELL